MLFLPDTSLTHLSAAVPGNCFWKVTTTVTLEVARRTKKRILYQCDRGQYSFASRCCTSGFVLVAGSKSRKAKSFIALAREYSALFPFSSENVAVEIFESLSRIQGTFRKCSLCFAYLFISIIYFFEPTLPASTKACSPMITCIGRHVWQNGTIPTQLRPHL